MIIRTRYCLLLASLALGACATATPPVVSWEMPAVPLPEYPRLTRAESKANPPHPDMMYEDYNMEPTRFIFRPRNVATDDTNADNGNDTGDLGYQDFGGGMDAGY